MANLSLDESAALPSGFLMPASGRAGTAASFVGSLLQSVPRGSLLSMCPSPVCVVMLLQGTSPWVKAGSLL